MRAYDILFKKRNGGKLTDEEISFFVRSYTRGEIPDYQASAFLMAVYFRGMDYKETVSMTGSMADSGEKFDLTSVQGVKTDKHSTGGVGDGISLVLAPLAAACGACVPMVSGRGLGHTGGTLDKLESIPGFRVRLTKEEFSSQLRKIGVVMAGQTEQLAPADKKLYALRDVTATVDSIPLITASILSKKRAAGVDSLVLDVKTGSGAFMREKAGARDLAKTMVSIWKRMGKKAVALITDMSQPLGRAVGNSLEMKQAVEILQGKEEPATQSFIQLAEALGGWMLFLGKLSKSSGVGSEMIRKARLNGSGLKKLSDLVLAQGGNPAICEKPESVLPLAGHIKSVLSPWKGTLSVLDALSVGLASVSLGAGRARQEDLVNPSAGIVLLKKVGDLVERGEPLAELHYSGGMDPDGAEKRFLSGIKVGKTKPKSLSLIHEIIR